jgi:hypothetical protein
VAKFERDRHGFTQKKGRKTGEAAKSSVEKKIIRDETGKILSHGENRVIEVPDFGDSFDDPVFACFAIDASYSMRPYRDAVINNHPIMLETLRGSAKCKSDALYVMQYLFAEKPILLNPFERLDVRKNDQVVVLDKNRYDPDNCTALYQTVFYLLQDMMACIERSYEEGIQSSFSIAVITDGEDTCSGIDFQPAKIRTVIEDLRQKRYLRSSVVLGLTNQEFSAKHLEKISQTLGFEQSIPLNRNPRDIRRAFELASKSSLG